MAMALAGKASVFVRTVAIKVFITLNGPYVDTITRNGT